MQPFASNTWQDEERLGELAMRFRGSRRDDERRAIIQDYSETVERLIQSGNWHEMPAPEDQLPDESMPPSFSQYWNQELGLS